MPEHTTLLNKLDLSYEIIEINHEAYRLYIQRTLSKS